ncbi:MAG: tRNA (adenosine(37)-N6)-threonylcarbamoyltransferase complex transferase subunit TsaD [Candidatus Izemoplasmataceae bacterium]
MIVLGVESSCDETSVSVSKNGKTILSNVVLSQMSLHAAFGGVVPEIASREHVKGITVTFEEAINKAGISIDEIDLVAVTKGPGLIGSLLTGINAAKAFAFAHDLPIVGIHHIAGHIYANQIEDDLKFPLVCLVVSGGHTELILMKKHYDFEKLGETQDDAIGEAYDKIARVLGLSYPGGPIIDAYAQKGKLTYKMPKIETKGTYDFSYSGLKSHVINLINTLKMKNEPIDIHAMCASFQQAAVEQVIEKARLAVDDLNAKMFIVAGGVAANSYLRKRVSETFNDTTVLIPKMEYCTDNAAMISIAGYYAYQNNQEKDGLDLNGDSRLKLS